MSGLPARSINLRDFELDPNEGERLSSSASEGMARLFYAHRGRTIHKWIHYLDIYERHFACYRNTPVRMLEIGVDKGGSLEVWRDYFGASATIVGIDINPECATYATAPNRIRIGSQDDPQFLQSVIQEMGTPDIVLDDGSHIARHQRATFRILFPILKDGGLYVIEDMHTSYFPGSYEGGYRRKGTAVEVVKDMIDDMHSWYHSKAASTPAPNQIGSVHVYPSLAVVEKQTMERPSCIKIH